MDFSMIIEGENFEGVTNCIDYIEYEVDWFAFNEAEKLDAFNKYFPYSPESPEYYPEQFMELSIVIPKINGVPIPYKAFVHGGGYISYMTSEEAIELLDLIVFNKSTGRDGKDCYLKMSNRKLSLNAMQVIHLLNMNLPNVNAM